ncbi:MAG TPA: alpha/beta hydrolase [Polyangium sp.]|nr:alpha/beta hydrolase [Polyangium sp.]
MPNLTHAEASELFRKTPEKFLDVGAGQAAYRRVGTGPDVLFVHGWPVSGATFRMLLPYLAPHVTCHILDLPGAGDSRFDANTPITVANHFRSVSRALDLLGLDQVAVVGHDSGGMIARHAVAGDRRVRAMGLLNTEQPQGLNWRFKMFLAPRGIPGFGKALGWVLSKPGLRRNKFILGDAFADRSRLEGEFDEFFLRPLHEVPARLDAAMRLLRSFEERYVLELAEVHKKINVPVQLVWGDRDPFFPVEWAREMVGTFSNARMHVVPGAGLFAHEERAEEVAKALLPVLVGAQT